MRKVEAATSKDVLLKARRPVATQNCLHRAAASVRDGERVHALRYKP